eukprot:COSAG01_NODE_3099_length_6589_cov_2.308783_4_plen_77_part_00
MVAPLRFMNLAAVLPLIVRAAVGPPKPVLGYSNWNGVGLSACLPEFASAWLTAAPLCCQASTTASTRASSATRPSS